MAKAKGLLVLAAIILVCSTVVLGTAVGQQVSVGAGDEEGRAERLLGLLDAAKSQVQLVFQILDSQGTAVPQAAKTGAGEAFRTGDQAAQDFNRGRYDEASEKAMKALNMIHGALKASPSGGAGERDREQVLALSQAIKRHYTLVKRVEELVEAVKSRGLDTSGLERSLVWARGNLTMASEMVSRGKISDAAKKLGEARGALAGMMGQVEGLAKTQKGRAVAMHLKSFSERLSQTEERLKRVPPQAQDQAAKEALSRAKEKADEAKRYMAQGRVDFALNSLEVAARDLKRGSPKEDDEKTGLEKNLEKKAEALEKRLGQLEQKVKDTHDGNIRRQLLKMVEDARRLLQEARELLGKHNVKEGINLLNRVENLLEQAAIRLGSQGKGP